MRQYVEQAEAEEIAAYSSGRSRDCREEEKSALIVAVLIVIQLLFDGGI